MQIESACKVSGQTALLATALVIAVATGGCGGVKEKVGEIRAGNGKAPGQQPAPSPTVPPAVQATPPAPPTVQATPPEAGPPKARIGARAPIPARPLSVRSECTARDATGYTESIKLAVDQGRVGQMEAKIQIPRHGSCGFYLSEFRQTRTEPHVELKSSSGTKCTVQMWQQDGGFTVAFSECHEKCTRGAFDYVWPMHLKVADGSCQ